jgi:hypothetical protein
MVPAHDPEQAIVNTPVESSKESQLAEEIQQLVSERKTLLEVKRTDLLNNFLLKVVNPNIYALDTFWAKGASIDSLESELFNASLQLKELREETMKGIWSSVIGSQIITEDLNAGDFPVLTSLGVDLETDFQVKGILCNIAKLSKKVNSTPILTFEASDGKLLTRVQIPGRVWLERFLLNIGNINWFINMLDAIIPADPDFDLMQVLDEDLNDELGIARNDAARWIAIHVRKAFPNEFVKAAQHIGIPVNQEPMKPEFAQAMLHDMNIGPKATKILQQYTKAHLG